MSRGGKLDLLGPDGQPIRVERADPDAPVQDHVDSLCRSFDQKIREHADLGVSTASVLEALVQLVGKTQVSRGADPKTALQQVVQRFMATYSHYAGVARRHLHRGDEGADEER